MRAGAGPKAVGGVHCSGFCRPGWRDAKRQICAISVLALWVGYFLEIAMSQHFLCHEFKLLFLHGMQQDVWECPRGKCKEIRRIGQSADGQPIAGRDALHTPALRVLAPHPVVIPRPHAACPGIGLADRRSK
jgi:hypothetical protein